MELSFLSLLYPSMLGIRYSDEDLSCIKIHHLRSSLEIFPLLSSQLQAQLNQQMWQSLWKRALEFQEKTGAQFSSCFCEDYPADLLTLQRPPPMISYLGKPIWKDKKLMSVVGSRKPLSESLKWMTHHLPSTLKAAQLSVVSGGARGIDQWAHQLSLQSGQSTLCVIPSGLAEIYPESLLSLASQILETGGAILSAYTVDQRMKKYFFLERNQLIVALSQYCLVVEAGLKSGSLVTGREALEMERVVMTLPFSPWCGAGVGSNLLLTQQAHLVTNDHEMIEVIFNSHREI